MHGLSLEGMGTYVDDYGHMALCSAPSKPLCPLLSIHSLAFVSVTFPSSCPASKLASLGRRETIPQVIVELRLLAQVVDRSALPLPLDPGVAH